MKRALIAGSALLILAYHAAATDTGQSHYDLFWAGMLIFYVPATLLLCRRDLSRGRRLAIVLLLALADALPKALRSPQHLVFYDELAHFTQTETARARGMLFEPNPLLPAARGFPGLHALAASLGDLSGLTTFQIAVALLVALHVLALLGIVAIGEAIGQPPAVAAFAALLYSINPGFLYFDAMFAYESLALVFFIWALAALARMHAAIGGEQTGWMLAACVLGAACIVTHHVSSYLLLLMALLLCAIVLAQRWHGTLRAAPIRRSLGFLLVMLIGVAGWTLRIAPGMGAYLGPIARGFLTDAVGLLAPHAHHRTLFSASTTPDYERVAAYASPVLAGIAIIPAAVQARRTDPPRPPMMYAIWTLAVLYFLSLPLMLTQGGNEAARRSWSFTTIGLALALAPAIARLVEATGARHAHPPRTIGALIAWARRPTCALALFTALVGNTAMNTSELYRFPGPVVYGADTRTLTPEMLGAARWFRATIGPHQRIVGDRGTSMVFAAFADAWTATAWRRLPTWELYLSVHPPERALLRALAGSGYHYLIVDCRMAGALPRIGYYLAPGEPGYRTRSQPPPAAALDRYQRVPWTTKILQTDHLAIYRFDSDAIDRRWPAAVTDAADTVLDPVPAGRPAIRRPGSGLAPMRTQSCNQRLAGTL